MPHDSAGQMVAEWVDVWAPVVLDALRETEQPETLVLDSTDFWWTNTRTGVRRREFAVLVAYGYTEAGARRVWGVHASPTVQHTDYLDLLHGLHLPAAPLSIVSDDNHAVDAAVRTMWPAAVTPPARLAPAQAGRVRAGRPAAQRVPTPRSPDQPGPTPLVLPAGAPFLLLCEHHLRQRAAAALTAQQAGAPQGRWMRRLDTAFRRPEAWEEFRDAAGSLGGGAAEWVRRLDPAIAKQVEYRHLLPAHYSTAGAEAASASLRGLFEQRSFSLRNARRTDLLLGLARLHLNNQDDVGAYHRLLRRAAEQGAGRPQLHQRGNRDSRDAAGGPQPTLR
ncbi:hypothetical protein [Aquipuribacter sp. SD81]|uniref:hypothetical protein n=1 Tax=Aquipuribacter sp. SD81 TaxID=3127703 RepID=UPI0030174127